MDSKEAIRQLKWLQNGGDTEADHVDADGVLCELLRSLGHNDVVTEYHKVNKWYA